jgi:hypothetical protein
MFSQKGDAMPITIDDKAIDVFKIYDELSQAYLKDIEGYKEIIKSIKVAIDQKERDLQDIKNKAIELMKQSVASPAVAPLPKGKKLKAKTEKMKAEVIQVSVPVIKEKKGKIKKPEDKNLAVKTEEMRPEIVATSAIKEKKTRNPKVKAGTRKGKVRLKDLAAGKTEPEPKTPRIKKSEIAVQDKKNLKCLYHPESSAADIGRQLCSSCRWKLRAYGLIEYDKDPAVISFLKEETKLIPLLGQPMCPVHPEVPAYNKKTGLCQRCQSKAKAMGIIDRHPTEKELKGLRPA